MSGDRLRAEHEALRALLELIEQAERVRQIYERQNMAFPEPLRRLLGMSEGHGRSPKITASVPEPEYIAPPDSQHGWISVELRSASPGSVALAVLREAGQPLRAKVVAERVVKILPNSTAGSVANIGTKLEGAAIQRADEGWRLLDPTKAPLMFEGRLWGPPSIFGKYEIAAHRREAILHLLRVFHSGLQTSQIIEQLRACSWVHAPVSKEMVQDDIELLVSERKIRRRGASKKWELAREDKRT